MCPCAGAALSRVEVIYSYILDTDRMASLPVHARPIARATYFLLLCAPLIEAVSFSGHGLVRRLHDHVLSTFLFTALGHERQLRYGFNEETVII